MGSNSAITSGESYNRASGAPCVFLRAAIFLSGFVGTAHVTIMNIIITTEIRRDRYETSEIIIIVYLLPPKMDDHLKLSLAVCSACGSRNTCLMTEKNTKHSIY